mmetsp:Transcript_12793/g.49960  ORF Transcript_12793/g.49960 Transcript_12793/m.49960 type:complete len:205 (-) Transcript_12793:719-1333(-)
MPTADVWIHEYAEAMFPVAHPRSRSSQSMSAWGLRRSVVNRDAASASPERVAVARASIRRAASITAAVEYAQHPAHLPWCTMSPKSTTSDQSKCVGRFVPRGPAPSPDVPDDADPTRERAEDAASSTPLDVFRVRSDLFPRLAADGIVLDDPNAGKTLPNIPSGPAGSPSSSCFVFLSDGRRSPAAAAASVASFSDRGKVPSAA